MDKGYSNTSAFVEDGTYAKLRELAISYNINKNNFQQWFGVDFIESVKLSLIGRNLYTFTNYSGHDPEVGYGGRSSNSGFSPSSVTNDRLDYGNYPQFRSFSMSLQVKF